MRNTGEPLTPNLASPYVDSATGTTIVGNITATTTQPSVTVTTNTNTNTNVTTSQGNNVFIPRTMYEDNDYYYFEEPAFTEVTSSMKYTGGHIGTLKIPELNLSVKIYEGTTNSVLAKGVGHFKDTSIWNGNVCLAAHNRGTNDYFGEIHELDYGDTIKLTTKKGTRTYEVYSIKKISVNDTSRLQGTADNIIILITCVKNQADDYRWCVQGYEVDQNFLSDTHIFKFNSEIYTRGGIVMKFIKSFIIGLLCGSIIFGGTAGLANSDVLAKITSQIFFWNNESIELEAYNINGYNYVRMRDVAMIFGVNVE